jgi:hypothetical protein
MIRERAPDQGVALPQTPAQLSTELIHLGERAQSHEEAWLQLHLIASVTASRSALHHIFRECSILCALEWEIVDDRDGYGRGDLIFSNDHGLYVVVETKWLDLENRRPNNLVTLHQRRQAVLEQAYKYRSCFQRLLDARACNYVAVLGAAVTNNQNGFMDIQFCGDEEAVQDHLDGMVSAFEQARLSRAL